MCRVNNKQRQKENNSKAHSIARATSPVSYHWAGVQNMKCSPRAVRSAVPACCAGPVSGFGFGGALFSDTRQTTVRPSTGCPGRNRRVLELFVVHTPLVLPDVQKTIEFTTDRVWLAGYRETCCYGRSRGFSSIT